MCRYLYGVDRPEDLVSGLVNNNFIKEDMLSDLANIFDEWLTKCLTEKLKDWGESSTPQTPIAYTCLLQTDQATQFLHSSHIVRNDNNADSFGYTEPFPAGGRHLA